MKASEMSEVQIEQFDMFVSQTQRLEVAARQMVNYWNAMEPEIRKLLIQSQPVRNRTRGVMVQLNALAKHLGIEL